MIHRRPPALPGDNGISITLVEPQENTEPSRFLMWTICSAGYYIVAPTQQTQDIEPMLICC